MTIGYRIIEKVDNSELPTSKQQPIPKKALLGEDRVLEILEKKKN